MDWLLFGIIVFIPATIIHCWGRTDAWARVCRTIWHGAPPTRYRQSSDDADEAIELVPTARPAGVDFDKVAPSTSPRAAGPSVGGGGGVTARNGHALAEY